MQFWGQYEFTLDDRGRVSVPAHFREQMDVLRVRGVRSLDALAGDVVAGRRHRAPAVTVDDGYADFATTALPILRAANVPVTLFVTTGTLVADAEFWWDELERIVLAAPSVPDTLWIEIGSQPFSWSLATDGDRRALYHALHQRVGRGQSAQGRDGLLQSANAGFLESRVGDDALGVRGRLDHRAREHRPRILRTFGEELSV